MKLSISGAIESDRVLGPRVRRASQILEEVIGPTAPFVEADWSLVQDARGRSLARLALSDFTRSRVETRFEPDELANESRVRARFLTVWGDLLQARSHKQLDILSGKIQGGE